MARKSCQTSQTTQGGQVQNVEQQPCVVQVEEGRKCNEWFRWRRKHCHFRHSSRKDKLEDVKEEEMPKSNMEQMEGRIKKVNSVFSGLMFFNLWKFVCCFQCHWGWWRSKQGWVKESTYGSYCKAHDFYYKAWCTLYTRHFQPWQSNMAVNTWKDEKVVMEQPQEVQFAGVDEPLYRLWQAPRTWFSQLWQQGVKKCRFSELKSPSTSTVSRLNFSANNNYHQLKSQWLKWWLVRRLALHQPCWLHVMQPVLLFTWWQLHNLSFGVHLTGELQ